MALGWILALRTVVFAIVWQLPGTGAPDAALLEQARTAAAIHDEAVHADLSGDAVKAARLYRRALKVRPGQWESSLRLGTLNLRLSRAAEAEDALRYTIALGERQSQVDLCAARTNLGVLLFSASNSAGQKQQRQAASWAAEALAQYEAATFTGTCNVARLNSAKLLADVAKRDPPLPRDVPEIGQLKESREQLETAAAVQYAAALAVALEQDDIDTVERCAREYAVLQPGGSSARLLSTEQHVAVGRAALALGDRDGARYHTAAASILDPTGYAVYTNIALMAEQREAVEESVVAYRTAVRLARDSAARTRDAGVSARSIRGGAAASNNLGNILQGVGRLREALEAYDATLELRPENAEAWNNRGVALFAVGRHGDSVDSYAAALRLRPNFVQAFGGMMYVKTYTCDWQDRNADLAVLQACAGRWLSGAGPQVLLPLQALVYPLPSHLLRAITELHANQLRTGHANRLLSSKSDGPFADSGASSQPATGLNIPEVGLTHGAVLEPSTYTAEETRRGRLRLCYSSIGFGAHPHGQLIRGVLHFHDREKVEVVAFAFSDDDGSTERHDIARSVDHLVLLHAHSDPAAAMAQWNCDVAVYLDGYLLSARPELFYRFADENETEEAAEAAAAFAAAAASSSADLAAAAAAAAAWQTRLGLTNDVATDGFVESSHEDQNSFSSPRKQQGAASGGLGGYNGPKPIGEPGGVGGVQISLLYPGTLGSADFDYHVGDRIATPPELHVTQFTEVALIMPYSCVPTDYTRSYAAQTYTGSAPPVVPWLMDPNAALLEPLPPTSFRFVNFNQLFKVDPRTATGWANVLRRTPGATLWQLSTPPTGATRLKQEFRALGVHGRRLWFSERVCLSEHLGRIGSMSEPWSTGKAGLGLDTRQYNSRSTGTDMLWGGLPFLTVAGPSLASRIGASLAVAHGVPDLLAFSEKEYEDLAVSYSGGGSSGPADTIAVTTTDKVTGVEKILHVPIGGFGPGMGAATTNYLGDRQKQIGRWRAGSVEQYEWVQAQVRAGRGNEDGAASDGDGAGRGAAGGHGTAGMLFNTRDWVDAFEKRLGQAWQRYLVGRPLRDLGEVDDYDDGL